MAFFEERLDARISFGARGGPVWSTSVVKVRSGRRSVNRNWSAPLHRYQIGHSIKSNADFETVRAFFYVVSGAYDGFRFKDWSDYQATQSNSYLTNKAGSPSEWQLQRIYTVGARTYLRDIYKPVSTITVRRYRAGWSDASDAVVDYTTGTVQFSSHLAGDTYAWIGEFDVPVVFTADEMQASIVDNGADGFLVEWPSIELEEVRLTL